MYFPQNSQVGIRLEYIATLNPRGVNKLAVTNGYPMPRNDVKSRVGFLNTFIKENEEGMDNLFLIHPDKDIILETSIEKINEETGSEYDNWIGAVTGAIGGITDLGAKAIGTGKRGTDLKKQELSTQKALSRQETYKTMLEQKSKSESEKSKRRMYGIIGASVILLIIVVGVIFYLKKNK